MKQNAPIWNLKFVPLYFQNKQARAQERERSHFNIAIDPGNDSSVNSRGKPSDVAKAVSHDERYARETQKLLIS